MKFTVATKVNWECLPSFCFHLFVQTLNVKTVVLGKYTMEKTDVWFYLFHKDHHLSEKVKEQISNENAEKK